MNQKELKSGKNAKEGTLERLLIEQEGIEIYISSSQTLNSATLIGFISNDRTATPSMSSDGWYNFSCSLPSSTTGNNYLIFKAISGYGYNIYIDDISITQTAITTPTISYNSTTNITHNSATFNASYTQGAQTISSKGFKYKSQNDANWTTLQNLSTTSPFNANVNNLNPNTTYYVKSFITTQTNTYESAIDTFTTLPLISPTVTTNLATNISYNSVILNGTIIAGNEVIFYQGFEYKLSNSSIWTTLTANLNGNVINYNLSGLNQNSTYEYRAYAITAEGVTYGEIQSFRTLPIMPIVNTNPATAIAQTIATLNGDVTIGSETISAYGFEWRLQGASSWTIVPLTDNTFVYNLTGIIASNNYEFRAFVTTESANTYGSIQSFRTLDIVPPVIVTNSATSIDPTNATLNGLLTPGSEEILAQGFEWKLVSATAWMRVELTPGNNILAHTFTDLVPNRAYEFKAYVTTESGTIYGQIQNFTTPVIPQVVSTSSVTNITQTNATFNAIITSGSESLITQGFEWKLSSASTWNSLSLNGNAIIHNLTGLNPNSAYQYRAYATTASGTVYGTTQNFTTLSITPPTVVTNPTTNVTDYSLTLNGTIIAGSETITAFCFFEQVFSLCEVFSVHKYSFVKHFPALLHRQE